MAWLVSALGAALALAGAVSLANGLYYIRVDWGQAETVAGTVALSGGIVTLALGAVLFALRDGARRPAPSPAAGVLEAAAPPMNAWVDAEPGFAPALSEPAYASPDQLEPVRAAPAFDPPPNAAVRLPPAEAPTVVGRYEANGASYVLFSDGTIEVETETGTHRFASMDALKAHIERGGAS